MISCEAGSPGRISKHKLRSFVLGNPAGAQAATHTSGIEQWDLSGGNEQIKHGKTRSDPAARTH